MKKNNRRDKGNLFLLSRMIKKRNLIVLLFVQQEMDKRKGRKNEFFSKRIKN